MTRSLENVNPAGYYTAAQVDALLAALDNGVAHVITADATVNNTTAETDLFALNIPTNLVAGNVLEFEAGGTIVNNTAGAITFTFKIYVGGTAYITTGGVSITAGSTAPRRWSIRGKLVIVDPAATQEMLASIMISTPSSSSQMPPSASANISAPGNVSTAKNLTSASTLKATVAMGTADANATIVCTTALLIAHRNA